MHSLFHRGYDTQEYFRVIKLGVKFNVSVKSLVRFMLDDASALCALVKQKAVVALECWRGH